MDHVGRHRIVGGMSADAGVLPAYSCARGAPHHAAPGRSHADVRRREVSIEEMRAKAAGHSGELSRHSLEISRLHVELDKKMALIFAMRAREQVRKNMIRRIVKILMFMFVRSSRQRQRYVFEATLNQATRRA
jgi:hypothetical protein